MLDLPSIAVPLPDELGHLLADTRQATRIAVGAWVHSHHSRHLVKDETRTFAGKNTTMLQVTRNNHSPSDNGRALHIVLLWTVQNHIAGVTLYYVPRTVLLYYLQDT